MKGFRHAVVLVLAAYAITYGVLVLIEYHWIEEVAADHAKFTPEAPWIFAALHATMIFGAFALIGMLFAVLWFLCDCLRSRRRRVPSEPHDDVTSSG